MQGSYSFHCNQFSFVLPTKSYTAHTLMSEAERDAHTRLTDAQLRVFNKYDILISLLTPLSRVFLEKLTGSAASQEIPRIFGIRRFITVLTSVRHLSLCWANSIQSPQPLPTSWRSILILSYRLRLGLPNGLFPSGFPTRTLYTPLPCPLCSTCPSHLILLYSR